MHVCVVDAEGRTQVHLNLPCDPGRFLKVIERYRERLVVCCECLFAWYWLADLCRAVRSDLAFAEHLDEQLRGIELYLTQHAKIDDPQEFGRLQTVPGIGPILAMVMIREVLAAKSYVARLEKKHGKAKAISILSARLGRTVYWMLKRKESFEEPRFLK